MEAWSVFLIIVEIVAFLALILPFFSKLNNTLGALNATVAELRESVKDSNKKNRETHGEIFGRLNDHETRISHLEK